MNILHAFLLRKRRRIIAGISVLLVFSVVVLSIVLLTKKTFYKGVFVEGIDMSGFDREMAGEFVKRKVDSFLAENRITFSYGDTKWSYHPQDILLGFMYDRAVEQAYSAGRKGNIVKRLYNIIKMSFNRIDIKTDCVYDSNKLKNILVSIKKQIDTTAKNSEISFENDRIVISRDIRGKLLDIDKNMKLIENHILEREFNDVYLIVEDITPDIVYDDIKEVDRILASFSTAFNAQDVDRSDNIRLACKKINNTVIYPGEVFSMNNALGPRTVDNGYLEAPVIFGDELVKGPGGGVCQVTTTLYDAVLLAKLDVKERIHHSLPLGYVEPGQDATIAGDTIDLKFLNNRNYPICLNSNVTGNTLCIKILGKGEASDDFKVELKSEVVEEYQPGEDEYIVDDSIPDDMKVLVREARKGLKAIVYRYTYNDKGEILQKEIISNDVYKPVNAQYKVNRDNYERIVRTVSTD